MRVTVNSQTLAQELRAINQVVATKATLPILTHVLIGTNGPMLNFWATDLEIGLFTHCRAETTADGVIALPAKRLLDLVEQFPSSDVTLELDDKLKVRVTCGAFTSRLQALSHQDFPTQPVPGGDFSPLNGPAVHNLIERTKYAIAESSSKYVLQGALLTLTGTMAAMVATDSKRLSIGLMERSNGPELRVVLPLKALAALLPHIQSPEIHLHVGARHIFVKSGVRLLTSRRMDGEFPSYDRIIPRECTSRAVVQRVALAAALRRVGLITDDTGATYLDFADAHLTLTAASAEVGDAHERVAMHYTGDASKVCLNWRYLLDFLEGATEEMVALEFKDGMAILCSDGNKFLNVILLLRP